MNNKLNGAQNQNKFTNRGKAQCSLPNKGASADFSLKSILTLHPHFQ